jgi:hypothetical protein
MLGTLTSQIAPGWCTHITCTSMQVCTQIENVQLWNLQKLDHHAEVHIYDGFNLISNKILGAI